MRKVQTLLVALVPTLLVLLIAFLYGQGVFENFFLVGEYRFDAEALLSTLGFALGALILFVLLTFWWAEKRLETTLASEREILSSARLGFYRRLDHELKNPLTVIRLGIANLQPSPNLSAEERSSIQRIGQSVDRLQKLVQDLRWLYELEEHRLEIYPVDLVTVLEEAVELASQTYPGRNVSLNIQHVPWPVAPVSGDRDMLVLVFRNLLDNALKYSAAEDRVEVRASDDGNWATVEIADTGLGIPNNQLSRIFEELYRADNAQGVPGSGLGLALVWRILRLHGGRINVRSRENQGTIMRVLLRVTSHAA